MLREVRAVRALGLFRALPVPGSCFGLWMRRATGQQGMMSVIHFSGN